MPRIAPAHPRNAVAIRALLAAAGLPVDDLEASPVDFLVALDGGRVVGAAGLEVHGDAGLLRSLVVASSHRGTGLGRALARAIEGDARQRGLRQLVLLTQTAAPFFASDGYLQIPRDAAPAAIRATAEFASLCPASATCMAKALSPERP
jgi:amino-acid N-acetyltransferase